MIDALKVGQVSFTNDASAVSLGMCVCIDSRELLSILFVTVVCIVVLVTSSKIL